VRVNFDLILKALLREVKYLLLLDLDVPETASDLYASVDKFRHQTGQLELIVDMYNGMLEKLLPVEKPLFSDRIEKMNKALQPGIDTLMWNSEGIIPYINSAMKIVSEVDVLVKKMKDNVMGIRSKMEDWRKPLFERKAKTADPEMVATIHNAAVEAERENIRSQGKDIHKLMKDTLDNVKPDKKGKAWLDYVDYVNGLVIEGITVAIDSSMKFMADQLNIKQNQVNMWSPIFEIKVDLEGGDLAFGPSIEANDRENGIRDIINAIVNDFISIAIQIPRLDSKDAATGGDFLVEIKDQFQLFGTLQEIALNLDEITASSNKFLDQYRYCDFLWKNDVEQSFREFLNSGQDLKEIYHAEQKIKNKRDDAEEEDALMKEAMTRYQFFEDKILKDVTTRQPDLVEFDKKIEFLHSVKNDISGMKESHNIGWLKVNTQNLIDKLLATCQTWIDKYTKHLVTNTEVEIENIKEFIDKVSKGIQKLPENCVTQAEKDQLMEVMIHLRDVRMVTGGALATIEPLKQQITLLRKHGVQM
jgi:dynein heavy chain, axonemal